MFGLSVVHRFAHNLCKWAYQDFEFRCRTLYERHLSQSYPTLIDIIRYVYYDVIFTFVGHVSVHGLCVHPVWTQTGSILMTRYGRYYCFISYQHLTFWFCYGFVNFSHLFHDVYAYPSRQYWITNPKQACMGSDAICVPYLLLLLPSGFDLITEPEVLIGFGQGPTQCVTGLLYSW